MLALLEHVAAHGPPKNRQKSNDLGEGIFELKPTDQIRLLYFFDDGRRIVMTHGVVKKRQKMDRVEIGKALDLRGRYLKARRTQRDAI